MVFWVLGAGSASGIMISGQGWMARIGFVIAIKTLSNHLQTCTSALFVLRRPDLVPFRPFEVPIISMRSALE